MKTITILPSKVALTIHMAAKKDFKVMMVEISIDLLKMNNLGASYPPCKSFRVRGWEEKQDIVFDFCPRPDE